jgi:hypothetical protein
VNGTNYTTHNINRAIWTYQYGPNFMQNESLPRRYYVACGNMRFGLAGHCSLPAVTSHLMEIYKCIAYDLVYQPKRVYPEYDVEGVDGGLKFLILSSLPILCTVFMLGILNFIIMTRVQKHLEGSGSASLLLHQTEIACDILSAWLSIPYSSIVYERTPDGKRPKPFVFCAVCVVRSIVKVFFHSEQGTGNKCMQ